MDTSPQPIPTFVTSPKASTAGNGTDQKPRYTKAERRQFAKEKKAAGKNAHNPQPMRKEAVKKNAAFHELSALSAKDIDAMLVRLLELKQQKERQGDRSLAGRITRDAPKEKKEKKKELSSEKLEKIQKRREQRRELRAERRKTLLAKKTAEVGGAEVAPSAPILAPASVPAALQTLPEEDEINFDEL